MDDFSFKPLTPQERAKNTEELHRINQETKAVVESAKACLSSDSFVRYRKEYELAEKKLIDAGIRLSIADPIAYAVASHTIFTNLKLLKMLIDMVEHDSAKGAKWKKKGKKMYLTPLSKRGII